MTAVPESTFNFRDHFQKTFSSLSSTVDVFDFSHSVLSSLIDNEHLIITALPEPVRQIGYLVPAAYYATTHGKRVLIACPHDKLDSGAHPFAQALQYLREKLSLSFSTDVLRDRGDYLCIHKYENLCGKGTFSGIHFYPLGSAQYLFLKWASTTETGLFEECPIQIPKKDKEQLSCTVHDCFGETCTHFSNCHFSIK